MSHASPNSTKRGWNRTLSFRLRVYGGVCTGSSLMPFVLWQDVRTAFRKLRVLTTQELQTFFGKRRVHTDTIKSRGPALPLTVIPKDDRYLISEMACKSYDESADGGGAPGKDNPGTQLNVRNVLD